MGNIGFGAAVDAVHDVGNIGFGASVRCGLEIRAVCF